MNIAVKPAAVSELVYLTVGEASRLIATRKLSPVELAQAYLKRIEAVDETLHGYITLLADNALAAAKEAEAEIMRGRWRGPLHGIPYGVKDNYHVKGVRTTGASRLMLDHVADETATAIEKLEAAGAILLGKLNTWEYGTGTGEVWPDLPFPLARNPWNTERFTGGSSTGAGVATAAGLAMFALGSDTGGSVRLPAAATGVYGMKATYGLISRAGILPNCWSLDVPGALTWTAGDNAIVSQAIAGFDPRDPQSADVPTPNFSAALEDGVSGMTIGVIRDFGADAPEIEADTLANLSKTEDMLVALGAKLVEIALPAPLSRYRAVTGVINWAESLSIHEKDFMERSHLMGKALRDKMTSGFTLRAVDYVAATRHRRELALSSDAVICSCDAVLAPCTFLTAPPFGGQERLVRFTFGSATSIFNVTGHPAISIPTGFDADGLPTSAQIVGKYFDEATVYRVSCALEKAAETRAIRPKI
jgi:Asp-tRNA(Asn)/Glu-tRNA(Gln) amidotransferase A subunit family amidase